METSEGEGRRGGGVELCSPCHCLQTCINALLKCLGFEFDPGSTAGRSPDRHGSQAPRHETLLDEEEEEEEEGYFEGERRWTSRRRQPTRPPISTGGGGQTN